MPSEHCSVFLQSRSAHFRSALLACLLSCVVLSHSTAFALEANRTLTQYTHRIWGQEEGLEQPTVYSILQSRSGYLWLGTQDALVRFDGVHFRDFDSSLEAQRGVIRSLLEDKQGNLWFGSVGGGLTRLSEDGSFRRYSKKDGLPSTDIFCLASDSKNRLWICTNEGLTQWQNNHFRVFTTADGLPSNQVRYACEATDGTFWVAGVSFGVGRWSGTHFEPVQQSPVTALDCAKDGSVWVGTETGLTQITRSGKRPFSTLDGLPDNAVSSLAEGPNGNMWVGTHDGVSRYRVNSKGKAEFSTYRTRDGLSHSSVLSLYFDREGSLWAGTKNGLDQFTDGNVTPYTTHEGMPSNDAGPVLEDASGKLWVGTLNDGLAVFDGNQFKQLTTRDGLTDNRILSLELDRQNDIWVGTAKGLNRLHDGRVKATYGKNSGLSGDEIRSLFEDVQGTLWAGTNSGLDVFDGKVFKTVDIVAGTDPNIAALGGGSSVRLFVGGSPGSLYLLKDNQFKNYPLSGVTRSISCYYLDHVHHIAWMGTLGSGLLRWQNGTLTHFRLRDGLYDNRIYSILKDDFSNFWFASSKGIFRVSEKDLEEFAAQKTNTIHSLPFSTGQLRFECQSGVQPAAYRTHDGRLWFSTSSGLVVVDPSHLLRTKISPPVHITSIFVNGARLEPDGQNILKPWQKNLEIRYAGLSFVSPEKVTFRYMLEGYEKNWTEVGSRREAFFTNLPPGHFRFKVEARNADGIQSTQSASIVFTIQPLFYQRPWFWPVLIALVSLAIAGGYRLRIRHLKSQFDLVLAERTRIARELHDTLLQGLSGVTMQLQALWKRLPISLERDTLADIIKDAGRCSSEARQSLWGLRVISGESLGLSANLTKLARQAVVGKPIALVLEIEQISLRLIPEVEFQLLRIAQESIANALQHAGAGSLEVSLRLIDQELEMVIKDDGDGFSVDFEPIPFGHFGLLGMRERAAGIGANFTVVSAPAEGTAVIVTLPISSAVTSRSNLERLVEHQIR